MGKQTSLLSFFLTIILFAMSCQSIKVPQKKLAPLTKTSISPTETSIPATQTLKPIPSPSEKTKVISINSPTYTNSEMGVVIDNEENYIIKEGDSRKLSDYNHEYDVLNISILPNPRPDYHHESLLNTVWQINLQPEKMEEMIELWIGRYKDLTNPQKQFITVGGYDAVALYPMPGTEINTQIFVTANNHVYFIYYYAEINEEAIALLDLVSFIEPVK